VKCETGDGFITVWFLEMISQHSHWSLEEE